MKRFLLKSSVLLVALAFPCVACSSSPTAHAAPSEVKKSKWQQEVDELDAEIDRLTNQRNLYLGKATKFQNQGDRLQFNTNNLLDARMAWQQAEINREIASRIQNEIDLLEKKRSGILEAHGVKEEKKEEKK